MKQSLSFIMYYASLWFPLKNECEISHLLHSDILYLSRFLQLALLLFSLLQSHTRTHARTRTHGGDVQWLDTCKHGD